MVRVFVPCVRISPCGVKTKTVELVFAASLLRVRIMCRSGTDLLSTDC